MNNGIDAPASVAEGTQPPIKVSAPAGTEELVITVIGGTSRIYVDVDDDGTAQFELPADAIAGTSLSVIDPDDPSRSTEIDVTAPLSLSS